MRITLVVVSVVVAASRLYAAAPLPYRFALIDCGGIPGSLGLPITWAGSGDNRAYRSGAGSLNPPSADLIDFIPRVQWDDYFMMDPLGQSDCGDPSVEGDGRTAGSAGFVISGSGFDSGRMFGVLNTSISPDGEYGHAAGPDGRVFLANFTLRVGSGLPTTEGTIVQILREGNTPQGPENSFVFPALRFGIENATNVASHSLGEPQVFSQRYYYLDYIATPVPASELPASFGAGINYQIFLAQTDIPAPASASFLFGAGVVALRRRR